MFFSNRAAPGILHTLLLVKIWFAQDKLTSTICNKSLNFIFTLTLAMRILGNLFPNQNESVLLISVTTHGK